MGDKYKDSEQDSALQTPQPDQPHPPLQPSDAPEDSPPRPEESERRDDQAEDSPPVHVDNPAAPD